MMANYRAIATQAARRAGIPVPIFLRQIQQESGFNPNARSSAGALGIAQFMPATARGAGINPLNPVAALNAAAQMDARNLAKYHNWQDVLSLYNSGRGWSQGRHIGETRNYVSSILGGGSASPGVAQALPTASPLGQAAPRPDLRGLRANVLNALLTASQSTADHQTPDYMPVFQAIAALRGARVGSGAPPPPAGSSAGAPQGAPSLGRFDGKAVAGWIAPILREARAAGWTGTVESGYRSYAQQARIYASGVRPAARPGTSNHEFTSYPGGAVDVTNPQQLNDVLRRLGISKLQWAGAKDEPHFSHPHGGGY